MQSPGSKNNSKKRAEKGPAQRLRQRTAILILLILVLGFGAAVLRLTYLTTVQSSELQESAVDLQLADTTVSAKRGTIYDANGNVLAESASVWQVVMSPVNFKNDKQRQAAAKGLSEIFDLEYNDVLDDTKQQSHYVVVKRRIESDEREKVLQLIDTLKKDYSCSGVIQLLDDYKRYYPNGGGSIFTFEIKGGAEKARKFCESLELFSLLANVADVKSLVIHPASTTHSQMTEEELKAGGITPSTVRLSIGTEHIDDILEDLEQGFRAIL